MEYEVLNTPISLTCIKPVLCISQNKNCVVRIKRLKNKKTEKREIVLLHTIFLIVIVKIYLKHQTYYQWHFWQFGVYCSCLTPTFYSLKYWITCWVNYFLKTIQLDNKAICTKRLSPNCCSQHRTKSSSHKTATGHQSYSWSQIERHFTQVY